MAPPRRSKVVLKMPMKKDQCSEVQRLYMKDGKVMISMSGQGADMPLDEWKGQRKPEPLQQDGADKLDVPILNGSQVSSDDIGDLPMTAPRKLVVELGPLGIHRNGYPIGYYAYVPKRVLLRSGKFSDAVGLELDEAVKIGFQIEDHQLYPECYWLESNEAGKKQTFARLVKKLMDCGFTLHKQPSNWEEFKTAFSMVRVESKPLPQPSSAAESRHLGRILAAQRVEG